MGCCKSKQGEQKQLLLSTLANKDSSTPTAPEKNAVQDHHGSSATLNTTVPISETQLKVSTDPRDTGTQQHANNSQVSNTSTSTPLADQPSQSSVTPSSPRSHLEREPSQSSPTFLKLKSHAAKQPSQGNSTIRQASQSRQSPRAPSLEGTSSADLEAQEKGTQAGPSTSYESNTNESVSSNPPYVTGSLDHLPESEDSSEDSFGSPGDYGTIKYKESKKLSSQLNAYSPKEFKAQKTPTATPLVESSEANKEESPKKKKKKSFVQKLNFFGKIKKKKSKDKYNEKQQINKKKKIKREKAK